MKKFIIKNQIIWAIIGLLPIGIFFYKNNFYWSICTIIQIIGIVLYWLSVKFKMSKN